MSEHIDAAEALALSALSKTDPERLAAEAHARTCPPCDALLREGQALLSLLDGAQLPVRVDPALKARIETRLFVRPRVGARWAALAAAMISFLLVLFDGKSRGALDLAEGVHCMGFEACFAAVPLVLGVALTRFGSLRLQPSLFAACTMTCAVFGQVLLRTRCEAHALSLHLFVFHFLVVLAAGLVAAGSVYLTAPAAR